MPSFDDFLGALTSRRRKAIRKERAQAREGLRVRGAARRRTSARAEWDAMWAFYQDTGSRKWGRPYLTREFFDLIGERMGDALLLFLAYRGSQPVAGALNFIGADTLYGRYWGCTEEVPFLHFELCYYQAIEWAIDHGLACVQAGAQGEHKLARGYEPVITRSAHFLPNPELPRRRSRSSSTASARASSRKPSGCAKACPTVRPRRNRWRRSGRSNRPSRGTSPGW